MSVLRIEKQPRLDETKELLAIIADELNIKQVEIVDSLSKDASWVITEDKNIKIAIYITISPAYGKRAWSRNHPSSQRPAQRIKSTPNDIVSAIVQTDDAELKDV